MDGKREPQPDLNNAQILASQNIPLEPPPPYSDTPIPEIALEPMFILNAPMTLRLIGHYTKPDFTLYDDTDHAILAVTTDSYLISHEMEIRELINGSNLFTVKRSNSGPGGQNWMYAAKEPGRAGKKILELETRPNLLREVGKSTRLTFRNKKSRTGNGNADPNGELEAIDLRFGGASEETNDGSSSSISGCKADVWYHEHQIGNIELISKRLKGPEFVLNISYSGVDPTLFVILALALDDRAMSNRRRRRRPIGRNAVGIGKGPGAGLTIPLAISGGGW